MIPGLDAIKARAEAADRGPWVAVTNEPNGDTTVSAICHSNGDLSSRAGGES